MEERIVLDSVGRYNELFGLPTAHPLVSVVDLSQATRTVREVVMSYGVYALFLKQVRCGDIRRQRNIIEVRMDPETRPSAKGLLFHPDLIRGTSLGREIKRYSFFAYSSNEALHLSDEEKVIFTDCLNKIRLELERPADSHSKRLIVRNIELLLDYCMRFYERQFATRSVVNKDILVRFEDLLNGYFSSDRSRELGLPTVRYFADKICLSPNYFGDLIKKETGRTPQEYIQAKIIDLSKELILEPGKTVSQVAYDLGFQYSQHFNRVFKKNVGCTPNEYRKRQLSAV